MNYKYIDAEELRKNFLISEGKGYIIPEFKRQLTQIVEDVLKKYRMTSELDRKILCWSSLKDVCVFWIHINPKKYDNPFPYFTEITKRSLAKNYNKNIPDLRIEYYREQRKEKLNKINASKTSVIS